MPHALSIVYAKDTSRTQTLPGQDDMPQVTALALYRAVSMHPITKSDADIPLPQFSSRSATSLSNVLLFPWTSTRSELPFSDMIAVQTDRILLIWGDGGRCR